MRSSPEWLSGEPWTVLPVNSTGFARQNVGRPDRLACKPVIGNATIETADIGVYGRNAASCAYGSRVRSTIRRLPSMKT